MAQDPIHGLDLDLAASARQLQRDYRTLGQRFTAAWRRPPVLGIVCLVSAGVAWLYPALIDGVVVVGLVAGLTAWRQRPVLPLKLPDRYKGCDPHELSPGTGKPLPARGLLFLGNDRFAGDELYHSDADARTHCLVLGGTGSGKTEAMTSMASQTLLWGSGFTYVDGKGDAALWTKIFALARACGREDDLYVLNYMTGSTDIDPDAADDTRLSNTFNPFLHGSADAITQMLVAQMAEAGGDSGPWKDKAIGLLTAYVRTLVAMRDRGLDEQGRPFVLEVGAMRHYITLDNLIHLYLCARARVNGLTIPANALDALESYLLSVPGFQDPAKLMQQHQITLSVEAIQAHAYPTQPDPQTYLQHGYLQNQFNRMFNQLADVYGHIFRAGYAEIDLTDVVLQRRILVVMLPALEKSPDELANLGKLLISSLKAMLAVGLGAQLEGSHRAVIERRPTTSPSPYVGVFDEYGYYSVKGFAVVPAQARSLGFSVCFGGQDIQSFGKQSKEEADAIVGNTLTKIAMKIEDPKDTADLFEKLGGHAIAVQTSGFTRGHNTLLSGLYRDVPNATLERRARVDPLDLRAQRLGEAHIFHGTTVIRANLFYSGEFKSKAYRLNRLVPLGPPETDLKAQHALLTPEGLRQAVAHVVSESLDELKIAQQLAVALESRVTLAKGSFKDFAGQFVAEYLQGLEKLDAAIATTFRAVGRPTAATQADEQAESPKSVDLAKLPRAESEPQSADDWENQVKTVVDDVLRAADLTDDEGVDPREDTRHVGSGYQGVVGELATADPIEQSVSVGTVDSDAVAKPWDTDFADAELHASPMVVGELLLDNRAARDGEETH